MAEKKVAILIPYWIQEILKRNNLPLSTCLELDKIKSLVAINDIAKFLALQRTEYFKLITNTEVFSELAYIWQDSTTDSDLHDTLWNTISPIINDLTINKELESELFDKDSYDEAYNDPFIIYDLTPTVFGIVIYPGYFNTKTRNVNLQRNVVEGVLEILYRYSAFHDVAKTEYFRKYLELMSVGLVIK